MCIIEVYGTVLNYWVLMRSCFARELRSSKFRGFTASALEPLESCSTTITFSWTVLGYSWAVGSGWLAGLCRSVCGCVFEAIGGTKEQEKASAKKLEDQVEMMWLLSRLRVSIRSLNEHLSISNQSHALLVWLLECSPGVFSDFFSYQHS